MSISSATGAHKDCGHLFLTGKRWLEDRLNSLALADLQFIVSGCLNDSHKLLIFRRYLSSIPRSTSIPRSRARTGNVRDRDFDQNHLRFSGD